MNKVYIGQVNITFNENWHVYNYVYNFCPFRVYVIHIFHDCSYDDIFLLSALFYCFCWTHTCVNVL